MKYPNFCCQECGEPIGYIGLFFELIFGTMHDCEDHQ